jgi:hypothetical protein
MLSVEHSLEGFITGTEVLGENLPQCHFSPTQIQLDMSWARNGATAVGNRRLTASTTQLWHGQTGLILEHWSGHINKPAKGEGEGGKFMVLISSSIW